MSDDHYEARKRLTFEQAEGLEPLPTQLQLKELSPELRALLWHVVYESMVERRQQGHYSGPHLGDPWRTILREMHVVRYHRMADDFTTDFATHQKELRRLFERGEYGEVFGWLQWVLRQREVPYRFAGAVDFVLKKARAAYRVVDGRTIVPVGSEAELETLERAFADLAATEFHGARAHLRNAAAELTEGQWANSVRESIHAVESVVRVLEPSGEFSKALAQLEKTVGIHAAMRKGFGALYGYTSDEKGIRHPMLDKGAPKVDETDALFMLGTCAAFVSYLIGKPRAAGLLTKKPAD